MGTTEKRVTYVEVKREHEFVAKRYEVFLDGTKVCEVVRMDNEAKRHGYANSRLGYDTVRKHRWYVVDSEGLKGGRKGDTDWWDDSPSRMKALRPFFENALHLGYHGAREVLGTRSVY